MTVTITTVYDNELVTHELNDVVSIVKVLDNIMFMQNNGSTVTMNYNNITFTVRQEVNMLHTVYIYNNDRHLVRHGTIYCSDYSLIESDNYMILIMLSGNLVYSIRGSYIIVI